MFIRKSGPTFKGIQIEESIIQKSISVETEADSEDAELGGAKTQTFGFGLTTNLN